MDEKETDQKPVDERRPQSVLKQAAQVSVVIMVKGRHPAAVETNCRSSCSFLSLL